MNQPLIKSKDQGLPALTLVEMLVYLALFAIIFVSIILFIISLRDTNIRSNANTEVYKAAQFMLHHLETTTQDSTTIDLPNSIFDTDSGKLTLLSGENTYTYTLSDGSLLFDENATVTGITDTNVRVTKFKIETVYNDSDVLVGFRCGLTLQASKFNDLSADFQTSFLF